MQYNELYRIIDANINRASEALRVLEDWTRFSNSSQSSILNPQSLLNKKLKNIRHEVNKIFSQHINLILNRESDSDVGKNIDNPSSKKNIRDIIHANCKRAEEALRVLFEYGQLINLDELTKKKLEDFRYEIYTIEKELLINEKFLRLNNSSLYLVTNRQEISSNSKFLDIINKAIEGGVDIIQLREKDTEEKEILSLARDIKKLIEGTNVLFIINDRVDIALACNADGVHLGQNDLLVEEARKITPAGFLIGLSTHSIEQGKAGLHSSADYLGTGPVFPTPTKPDYTPLGLEYINWAADNLKAKPWFAIGGIDENNIDKVISSGAKKVAVVRAIMNAQDPMQTTKFLKERIMKKEYAKAAR